MLKGNWRREEGLDSDIGNCWSFYRKRDRWLPSKECLEKESTPNSQRVMPQTPMSGKRTQQWLEQDLNWAPRKSNETIPKIGNKFGSWPNLDKLKVSPPTYGSNTTEQSNKLRKTSYSQLRWRGRSMFFGEPLAQENQEGHGKKQVWMPTPKTPTPSTGMVTRDNPMWSLMNSEELSISPMCFGGLIDTQPMWNVNLEPSLYEPPTFGLPATLTPDSGMEMKMNKPKMP